MFDKIVQFTQNRWRELTLGAFVIMAIGMLGMGRELYCTCGYIKFWHGIVISSENSQHLFDWYSFTHILHGLGFYALLSLFNKNLPWRTRLVMAVFIEAGWEILENTNFVINRYRAATLSLDYYGDSVINSIGDILAMLAGFWFAHKQKLWLSVTLFLAIELILLWFIRDNLTLNILMLVAPIEAIKNWQTL